MCKAITLFSLDGGKAELSHVFAHFLHVTALIVPVLKLQLQNMDAFMELSEPQQAAVCKEGAAVLSKWLGRNCNNAQGLLHLSGQILSVATDSAKEEWSNSEVGRG